MGLAAVAFDVTLLLGFKLFSISTLIRERDYTWMKDATCLIW